MTRHLAIGVVSVFLALQGLAQVAPERSAIRAMEKKRWEKAESQLRKSIRKDSINAPARYYLSIYFFKHDNPSFNLDSAYFYNLQSLADFSRSPLKDREKMKRLSLDSGSIIALRKDIDSAAFEHARHENTEEAFIRFLAAHPLAAQRKQALELRDEMAYLDALTKNTYQSFYTFLSKYPQAARAPEAKEKYDRLLYESETRDKRLQSFENFLREHPETPYRKEIEQNIFELFTLSGEAEKYLSFIQLYPTAEPVKKASDILYHILEEKDEGQWPGLFANDSIQNIHKLQQGYLVPFLHGGKFGFMDNGGLEIVPPVIDHLSDDYKCGNVTEDIIVLQDRILARDRSQVYSGHVEEVNDLGSGFLKLTTGKCHAVIHKSGYVIEACADNAKLLGNRFISLQRNNQWSIHALTGRQLIAEGWQDIVFNDNVFGFSKDNKWYLMTLQQLLEMADQQKTTLDEPYDEIKFLQDGSVWVRRQRSEAILDHSLAEIIPLNKHRLAPSFFGFIGQSDDGFTVYNKSGKPVSYFDNIEPNEPWIKVIKNGASFLFDIDKEEFLSRAYDSIKFEGPFALGVNPDSLDVYFYNKNFITFLQPVKARFIPGKDSTSFLMIGTETTSFRKGKKTITQKKTLYTRTGKELFSLDCDEVQYAGQDLFIVQKKEKKGLVNGNGKMILPIEYDAIGSVVNNVISLLKTMRFGLYNADLDNLIKPQYDKNLVPYNSRLIAAYDKGLYGLIDWNNKPEVPNEFEEIAYWNDTTALVKKNQLWALYDIAEKKIILPNIKEVNIISASPDEKLAIFKQGDRFGVLSNKKGIIIPMTFSDILNIGSPEEPLYFTEKHVAEAGVFVVIYYDKNGKLLRREVYEETEDYEKIYCPDQ